MRPVGADRSSSGASAPLSDPEPMHGRLALSDNRGFTLIELLVVIPIIAILARVALPIFTNQRTKAQDLRAQATIRTVATALATYHNDHEDYAATKAELVADGATLSQASPGLTVSGTGDSYEITETSTSGTDFTVRRKAVGPDERTCSVP